MSISRNTAVNLAGQVVPVLLSLLVVPPYLHKIGESRYGVLLMVWMLLGYFGILDLGLNRAVAQGIAELRDASADTRNRLMWTALILAGALSVVAGAAMYVAGSHGLDRCFGVENGPMRKEFLDALPWIALVMPANMMGGTLCGALQGREQFKSFNVIYTVGTFWAQVVPMTVAYVWSVKLVWLVPAALSSRVLTGIWMFADCRRTLPMTLRPVFDRSLIKSLFSFGGWVTVSSVAWPLLTTADRFVISLLRGPAAVTYYGVPYGVVSRVAIFPNAVSQAIFPRFAVGDRQSRVDLLVRSTNVLTALFTPICLGLIFLLGPFLTVWVGPNLAGRGTLVGELLVLGVWANGLDVLPHAYLQANAKPRISAIFHIAELLPYFLFLWLALKLWGVPGAALAGSLRIAVDTVLQYRACGYRLADWLEPAISAVALVAALIAVAALDPRNPLRWLIGLALIGPAVVWAWLRLPPEWRARILGYLPVGLRARWQVTN